MGPPGDSVPPPPPPSGPPDALGERGFPVGPDGVPPSGWTWQRWAVVASAVVVVGLVIAAIVLANRKPSSSPPPTAGVTASASESASPSPSPSDTPTPSPTPTATPTPTPTPTPHPTPTPVPANTPTQQAQLLFPTGGSECGSNGNYTGCPVTSGLRTAAQQWRSAHPGTQPLCRCPSTYSSPFAQQNDTLLPPGDQGNSDRAAVNVSLTIPGGIENMVVLLSRQSGAWIATDTYCDSRMNTLSSGAPATCMTH